ncbi:MAG: MATE family efflux transporter [Longimicrobiales bacterium]
MPDGFGSELRRLLRLAGPIVVSQLAAVGMNTADTIMVGPLGPVALAAVGVGSAIHVFLVLLFSGVLVGISPLVSHAFGRGDATECRQVMIQGLWLAVLLSIPVAIVSYYGGWVARVLGQDAAVAALAGEYTRALAPGVTPFFLFFALRTFLEAMGIARPSMAFAFLGLAVNILFNWLLIYGVDGVIPALGAAGTGWATTIVRWSMLAAILGYVLLRRELRAFAAPRRVPDRQRIADITRVGTPIGAQLALEVGLFAFAAIMMGWLGPVELAAHQVTINLAATTFMVALGTSQAGSILVGQHIGAARPDAVGRAVAATYTVAVGAMAIFAVLFVVAPGFLIGLYTPNEAIVDVATRLLLIAAAFQVFDGAQVAGISVLRGAADTRVPMNIAAIGYWGVGVPVAYLLAFALPVGYGPVGIWIGLSIALAVVAVLLGFRVRGMLRRVRDALEHAA